MKITNVYNRGGKASLLILTLGNNNVKTLFFGSFGGYHYMFIIVLICYLRHNLMSFTFK